MNRLMAILPFGDRKRSQEGMELVQVAILIAIAVGLGLIFRTQISKFVNNVFDGLLSSKFS